MNKKYPSNKVVSLSKKIACQKNFEDKKKDRNFRPNTRVIAITSGKGGVGKTNIVANVGFALSKLGKSVLILDADLGLGNIDVLLGLAPKYNLSHVIMGEKRIPEIILEGPGKIKILPASSGIQELTRLTEEQKIHILTELDRLISTIDVLLVDTGAGISSNVMYFNTTAQEIFVVVTPEPTSITDAYALIKVLSIKYSEKEFKVLVNMAANVKEAREVFRQLSLVADRFLNVSIEYIGYVLFDEKVTKGVRIQKIMSEIYPDAKASMCFNSLAKNICESAIPKLPSGGTNFFWKHLLQKNIS